MAGNSRKTERQQQAMIEEIITLLCSHNDYVSILKHISTKHKVSERQTARYIALARDDIKEHFKTDVDAVRVIASLRYETLYKKNYDAKDYRECRKVVDSHVRLFGANAPEEFNVNTTDNLSDLSMEDKAALVRLSRSLGK